ncbi:MAG: 4Fe-4S dicluster domain-containing protein [Planctomycetia bacterium]|nr:4Fe-4S dicluster domain-containing protein [Planctomycetia bacterium]
MKKVYPREEWCLGCKLCEVYCAAAHSRTGDLISAFKQEPKKPVSRIVVEGNTQHSIAISCRHCTAAPCVESCITGAMQRRPDGSIGCDETRCVGCMTCVLVCPFGAVHKGEGNKTISKCDLCTERGTPTCVEHCPAFALVYQENEEGGR